LRSEVARLAAQGLSKSGIARQVGISRTRVQQLLAG
jgi:DNA-binding NarL/FixJ family response regulator